MLARIGRALLILLFAMGLASPALAANQCRVPTDLRPERATLPPPGKTVNVPRGGHILALSWSPQFCKESGGEKKHASQCRGQNFGFILHGLWADGEGARDPVWCKRVGPVPLPVLRENFCATPSVGLMTREWAKHGSCIAPDAAAYFKAGRGLFNALAFPDMGALSQSQPSVAAFTQALSRANPGLPEAAIRVYLTPLNWLEDVRICLDRDFRPRGCRATLGVAGGNARMRIWPVGAVSR